MMTKLKTKKKKKRSELRKGASESGRIKIDKLINQPASSLGPSPDAAKPHERPNEHSRTNRDAEAGARPGTQWQLQ